MPRGFEAIRSLFRSAARGRDGTRRSGGETLASFFGPLELQVLETLWCRGGEVSVRGIQEEFPGAAYTTLMTTLDRLHKKGVLDRRKQGRAFLYAPHFTRETLRAALAENAIDGLLGRESSPRALRPILSCFVEAVSRRDALLLDDLEDLIRSRRRGRGENASRGNRG